MDGEGEKKDKAKEWMQLGREEGKWGRKERKW